MAKKSMIAREAKRARQVAKFAQKRAELKAVIANPESSEDAVWEAQIKLQKLPRDASPVRQQRRCRITGRPHAVYRKFGLCRNKLREAACVGMYLVWLRLAGKQSLNLGAKSYEYARSVGRYADSHPQRSNGWQGHCVYANF